MNEEVDMILEMAHEAMQHAIQHLEKELTKIRAGKASPLMVQSIVVEYYGTATPLNQVANVGTQDARTITIQPWEKKLIPVIEKAIMNANLGFNPENNGDVIRISVPILTEERRRDLMKQVNHEGENARIGLRSARKHANDEIKKMQKDGLAEDLAKDAEAKVQAMVDKYNKQVDEHLKAKEKDVMTV